MLHNGFGEKNKIGLSNLCMIWESGIRLTFFLQMETKGDQELNTAHDDLASYYAQA